jgi:protocatechuate 3,4-dioxygenase beta subunit
VLLVLGGIGLTDAIGQPAAQAAVEPANRAPTAKDEKTVTISGQCTDHETKALAGVQVILYRDDSTTMKSQRLQAITTRANGEFEFAGLPTLSNEEGRQSWYGLVMTKPGHGSMVRTLFTTHFDAPLRFTLRPAATLKGRVTDESGKPVTGAQVWSNKLMYSIIEGVWSTRTDAEGRYAITDMQEWPANARDPKPNGNGTFTTLAGCYFDVFHPDYAHTRPMYKNAPDTVDVVLVKGGTVDGMVRDQVTNKPASGVMVSVQQTHDMKEVAGAPDVRTDDNGKYRLSGLLAGKYNIWASAPDRTCAALDSFTVEAGKAHSAPNLVLIEGGWIEGRLIDAKTGGVFSGLPKNRRVSVAFYGPAHPKSGAACGGGEVNGNGYFRFRVTPGINYPYIMMPELWRRTQKREYYEKGIEVKAGETVNLEFRIEAP